MTGSTSPVDRDRGTFPAAERIAQPGRNCWRVERASRFYCVQDAADYFRLVRQALLNARKTVFSLGWDITAHIDLYPDATAQDAPTRLDKLLAYVARRRPQLRCYILTWDYGALYTLERDPLTRWRLGWRMPRGVRFGFDDHHPVGGCHHQKIVVIDDQLAFCGGIDLTGHRWDTSAHRAEEPARMTPLGMTYGPYHEVQAMVTGPVAARLGVLARDRWRALGTDRLPSVDGSTEDPWPSDITPDLTDVDVAIARTLPGSESRPAIRECEALFLDSIALAKQTIYIESQYFTNDKLASALAARLREPNGPEIIVITPKECHGWLEKTTMGAFRDGVFRRLIAADAYKRLRLVYPTASRTLDVPTFVHSKVMIVDDVLARIGSANYSHRSMGIDTECDLAVDAGSDSDAHAGIRHVRDRLLAEHLGLSADAVARWIERVGSIRALIDARETAEHTLVRIEMSEQATPPSAVLRAAADPDEPVAFGSSVESLVPAVDATSRRSSLRLWILPAVVLAAASAVAWRSSDTLGSIPDAPSSLWIGIGVFVASGFLLMPLELLAIAAGVCFGALRGGFVALIGSLAAAVIGYVAGRAIGAAGLPRWMSRRSYRSARQLGARGVVGLVVLRLSSVASAGSIHLMCGAGRIPFATYIAGTVIGLAPAIAALSGLGGLLRHTLLNPSVSNGLTTIGAAVLLLAIASGLRAFLLIRQFAPAISSHRGQAEFG
jgi:phospholipase D1/2